MVFIVFSLDVLVPPPTDGKSDVSMKFHVTGVTSRETTQLAELRIRPLNPDTNKNNKQNKKRIRKIRVVVFRNGEKIKQKNYKVAIKRDPSDGVNVVEITKIVEELLRDVDNANETTVEVTIRYKFGRKGNRRTRSIRDVTEKDAVLVIYSQDKDFFKQFHNPLLVEAEEELFEHRHKRHDRKNNGEHHEYTRYRRSTKKNKVKGANRMCGKKDFIVDFEEIGWAKWIVYPKRFNAYKCAGRCPSPVDQSFDPTNHSIMQSLMRILDKNVGRPCCVPINLSPLSMLYYEYGDIVIRHHENMVADTCGCR